jgi:hypothetical protein
MGSFEYTRPEVTLPHGMAAAHRALELNVGLLLIPQIAFPAF